MIKSNVVSTPSPAVDADPALAIAPGQHLNANQSAVAVLIARKQRPKAEYAKSAITALNILIRRDEFRDQIMLQGVGLPSTYHGPYSERALTFLRNTVLIRFGNDPGDDNLHFAIKALAEENRFNPVMDWLDGLSWDRTDRLSTWLPLVTGATDTPLHRTVGVILILGIVARAKFPGTKFDLCVVLEGLQGAGKSSLVRVLAGNEYFTDAPGMLAMDAKSRGELLGGKLIVELGELSGLGKAEVEAVKAAISQTEDHFRAPYERVATKRPRTCIFIGTTNADHYLNDTTGSRRFLPIACSNPINIRWLVSNREQLFAEAVGLLNAMIKRLGVHSVIGKPLPHDFPLWVPKTLWPDAAAAAEIRRVVDVGEEILAQIVETKMSDPNCKRASNGNPFIASTELADQLKLRLGNIPHARAIAAWMRKLGWESSRYGSPPGQTRGFSRPEKA